MSYKFQKILLTIELIIVVAVTLYTGTYAAKNPEEKVAVVESVDEAKASGTAKESESEKASETKKIKQTKETKAKDKKQETEPETKTQQAKAKAENKNTASSGKSGSTSTTGTSRNNSSAVSGGTASKPVTTTVATTKPSGNNNSNTSGTNHNASAPSGGTSSKPSTSTPSTSTPQTQAPEPARPQTPETTHVHTWVEQTHTVHHDATGHYEDVVIQDAWDEPVYDMVEKTYCSTCGLEIGGWAGQHLDETMYGGYWTTWEPVETGTIHHDAVTESRWVEDAAAWDETVSDGYRCSSCGATK